MIIELIELHCVGPFSETIHVGPLDQGLNILAANNEIGKSTIVRAASRALFDRHTCRSEEIKALRPVGTSLVPRVSVDFLLNDERYRIGKTFLESPSSQLSQLIDGSWQPIAEGDRADEKLQEILGTSQPGRGATKPEHWGLFRYLWSRQGEPATWPQWENDSGKIVRSRMAKIEIDPLIDNLKAAFHEKFGQIFTDSGRARTRGPLATSEEELAALKSELEDVRSKVQTLWDLQSRYLSLGDEIRQLAHEAEEKRLKADEIVRQAKEAELLLADLRGYQQTFDTVRKDLHAIEQDIKTNNNARERIEELNVQIENHLETVQETEDSETDLTTRRDEARKALQEKHGNRTDRQERLDRIQSLLKRQRAQGESNALRKQLEEAEVLFAEIIRLEEQKSKMPALSQQKFKKLRAMKEEIGKLSTKLEVSGITVELSPTKTRKVVATESGEAETINIKQGKSETIVSAYMLDLHLHGWGEMSIRSGAGEPKKLQERLEDKRQKLRTALEEMGASTVADVENLLQRRKECEKETKQEQQKLSKALDDFDDIAELKSEVNQKDALVANLGKSLRPNAEERSMSISEFEAQEERLKAELKQFESGIRKYDKEVESLSNALAKRLDKRTEAQRELAKLQERKRNTEDQITGISSRHPDGLDVAKTKAQRAFTEAEARLTTVRAKLPPDADKLPERNRRAAAAAVQVQLALDGKKEEKNRLQGTLDALGSEGLYSHETELLEKIEVKKAEIHSLYRRGWAARLLHDLLERRKLAATRAVLTPLQEKLSSSFADLTGITSRKVFLDENLQIRGAGRNEQEIVTFDLLSQGAKEQLLLALRLAAALALSDQEPQSVILDDVLVSTDPVRQERVLDLLQTASKNLQILVLTCHADRYRGVGKMQEIIRGNSPQ